MLENILRKTEIDEIAITKEKWTDNSKNFLNIYKISKRLKQKFQNWILYHVIRIL